MGNSVNSMGTSWCAARVAEARAWRDANSQRTPGWQHVHELLSQLDAPPAAAEAQGLGSGRLAEGADAYLKAYLADNPELDYEGGWSDLALKTAWIAGAKSQAARLATLEAAGAAGAGREVAGYALCIESCLAKPLLAPQDFLRQLAEMMREEATPKQQPEAEGGQADG